MGIVLTAQIVMRYVFNNSLVWSEELARYIYVWICFLGLSLGIMEGDHIRLEALVNRFTPSTQRVIEIFTSLVAFGFFALLIPSGFQFAMALNPVPSSAMGIPMSWVTFSVPVGLLLGEIALAAKIIGLIANREAVS
jgi:TRAP-type C4-dicarboxylate transport system permease small subunit